MNAYETAIWNENSRDYIVVVERCDNEDDALKMHKKWCDFAKTNPKYAYSIQFNRNELL